MFYPVIVNLKDSQCKSRVSNVIIVFCTLMTSVVSMVPNVNSPAEHVRCVSNLQ